MAKVLIVYDSKSGNTEQMAKAVERGLSSAGVEVVRSSELGLAASDSGISPLRGHSLRQDG